MRKSGILSAACATVLGALIAMPVQGADENSVLPPRPENAAINYLLAAAQLERAKTEEDFKAIQFIEDALPKLPPAALKARPDAVKILRARSRLWFDVEPPRRSRQAKVPIRCRLGTGS